MRYLPLVVIFGCQIALISQNIPARPFEKIVFPDLSPEWHFVNYDAEMDNGAFDGYNNFKTAVTFEHLIHNEAIFEIFYRQNTNEPTGSYLQSRSLKDGKLLWRRYIGYPQDPQQILSRNLMINSNGRLEVISQVKCDPYDPVYPLLGRNNMALYQIELDVLNGNITDEIHYSCTDTSYQQSNFDLFYVKSVSRFYSIQDTFYFTQGEWTGTNWQFVIFKLEKNFRKDKITSARFPKKYNCQGGLPIFFNDSTRIVFNSNCNTKRSEMTYLDSALKPIKTVISDSLSPKLNQLEVKKFDPIHRRFIFENVINFDTREIELLIVDEYGKLLKRILMPPVYNRAYGLLEWGDIDNFVFLASKVNYTNDLRPYVSLDVLKSDIHGSVHVSHSFIPKDSLRYISYNSLAGSDDDYYYLEINEASIQKSGTFYSLDLNASALSMIKIKKDQIINPTSGTNQSILNKLTCYPNPASENIKIDGLTIPATVSIFDINGRNIKTIENVTDQVHVQELPAGIYIFVIRNKDELERHKIIKVEYLK